MADSIMFIRAALSRLQLPRIAAQNFALLRTSGLTKCGLTKYASPSKFLLSGGLTRTFASGRKIANSATNLGFGGAVLRPQMIGKPRVVSSRGVGIWLMLSAAAVFGIVVLGGLTRLTESGLSITEWRPLTGSLPPMSQDDWMHEFALYKESPEFKELNSNITLEEFKFIYYMEWSHRLWGRAIGLLVLLPGLYFVLKRRTSPSTNRKLLAISGLLALQGFVGWWMVKSGLDKANLAARKDTQPRVSHYRLATHLGLALLLYAFMTFEGLRILRANKALKNPVKALTDLKLLESPLATPVRRFAAVLLGLGLLTSLSGSFVAGLDAGLLYNQFPLMGNGLIPSTRELFDKRYARGESIILGNLLDNPVTVQLVHRILATTTWSLCLAFFLYARKQRALLPANVFKGAHGVFGFATLQAAIGITTLIYVAPIPLAASHQAGAMAFLTTLIILVSRLSLPRPHLRKLINLMAQKAQQAAATVK